MMKFIKLKRPSYEDEILVNLDNVTFIEFDEAEATLHFNCEGYNNNVTVGISKDALLREIDSANKALTPKILAAT